MWHYESPSTRVLGVRVLAGAATCAAVLAAATGAPAQSLPGRFARLADTAPGAVSGLSPQDIVVSGTVAYFRAQFGGGALWRSNGRPGGTVRVDTGLMFDPIGLGDGRVVYARTGNPSGPAGVYVAAPGAAPALVAAGATGVPKWTGHASNVRMLDGRVLFMLGDSLRSWNAATGGVETLVGPPSMTGWSIAEVTLAGPRALVLRTTPAGIAEILSTDATASGTTAVVQLPAIPRWSSFMPALAADEGAAYFTLAAPGQGQQVWTTDGTASGTRLVGHLPAQFLSTSMWSSRGAPGMYWSAIVGRTVQLWHIGRAAGDAELLLSFSETQTRLTPIGSACGMSLFGDTSGTYTATSQNATLWISMGSVGTTMAAMHVLPTFSTGIAPGASIIGMDPAPTSLSAGDEVYFVGDAPEAGQEVWHVNAATGSMGVLADLAPGPAGSSPRVVFAIGAGMVGVVTGPDTGGVTTPPGPPGPVAMGDDVATVSPGASDNRVWAIQSGGARWIASPGTIETAIRPVALGRRVLMGIDVAGQGTEPYVLDLCPADYDNSGGAPAVNDLFAFVADWLGADPNADFDNSGSPPDTTDLFAFVGAWMAGCR